MNPKAKLGVSGAAAGLVYSSAEVTVALVSAAALSSWAP